MIRRIFIIDDKIQCLECKKLFYQITNNHLKNCCELSVKQYKEKYSNSEIMNIKSRKYLSKIRKGNANWCKGKTEKEKEEINKKRSESHKGKKKSNEAKQNMSIARKKLYEDGRAGPNKGKKFTEKHCKNLSSSLKGRKLSEGHCKKISEALKGKNNPMFEKEHRPESIQKMRIRRLNEIEEKYGIIFPNFSLDACRFFDWFNSEFNLNGQHALNGGEFHIRELGYFVDYYEPNLNLVIEWDEGHHYNFNVNLMERDTRRQKEIEENLKCDFIRININEFDSLQQVKNYVIRRMNGVFRYIEV